MTRRDRTANIKNMGALPCNACEKLFHSRFALEAHHHPYNGRCLSTEEMTTKGFVHKHGRWWTSFQKAPDRARSPDRPSVDLPVSPRPDRGS